MPVVYMVRCADGTFYTGWAVDVQARIDAHNRGRGAKYTAGRRPVTLVYAEACDSKAAALRREHVLKRLTRGQKARLARQTLPSLNPER
ncbi:MAG: GIY-YIG nuclease family protein [Acidobacteriota bacterium]